jgi:hypothetical protein
MGQDNLEINSGYERFYADRRAKRVYPTEFFVRVFWRITLI